MSDFLSKFTKENYNREKMKISNTPLEIKDFPIEIPTEKNESPVKNTKENNNKAIENYVQEEKTYIREEPSELDPEYKKKKRKKIIFISVITILLLLSSIFIYNKQSHTMMPNFVNLERQEVNNWANKNKINIIFQEEFSNDIEEDLIISQSVEANEKVKKGSDLQMVASLGADPDQLISLPDFSKMKASEIESWLMDNKMRYVQIEYQFSNHVEKDKFLAFEIKDKDVSKDKFLRKNKALITLSKGGEVFEKDILVLDFKNKTKQDIEAWMKEKEFVNSFTFEEAYHNDKFEDEVISQSIVAGEKVAKDQVLNFVISKGKAITSPNYANSDLNTFDTINSNGALVISKEIYTMGYPYGAFVEQSVAPGTVLNDKPDANIIVYYSLGKPYIKDLVGQSEGDLPAFFYEFKGRGANIGYTVHKIKDCGPKGSVIKASKDNEFIKTSDHVDVYVSDGSLTCELPLSEGEE